MPPAELRHSLNRYFGLNWDPGHIGETLAGQVVFAGIYDGYVSYVLITMYQARHSDEDRRFEIRHGGNAVSGFLQKELHALFEQVDPSEVPELVSGLQGVGSHRASIAVHPKSTLTPCKQLR